ncbi:MAG TPA: DUF3108 domain-containing protein, partial [Planctomycetota bacterium]|nr:DUF3108 domain-containing protein [Planctomycetota bacterium]
IVPLPPFEMQPDFKNPEDKDAVIEKLQYDITVDRFPAGKVEIEVKRQENYKSQPTPVFVVTMKTHSNRAFGFRYDVDDTAHSTFDAKGGFSRFFHMDRKEGGAKVVEKITFNYSKDTMAATYERPRLGDEQKWATSTIPLTGKSLDPLCAIFYLRSFAQPSAELKLKDIPIGKTVPAITLPICSDRHVWNTKLYKVGEDHHDIGDRKNQVCAVFEIDAPFKGLFERVGKMRVWVDVKTGLAVKMTAEIPIGAAEAVLNTDASQNLPTPKE